MSIEINMTAAKSGDCILLRCGNGEKKMNILIDSGQSRVYLNNALRCIQKRGETLDFLVLTHDDDDHVNGLCSLVEYVKAKSAGNEENMLKNTGLEHLSEERILYNFGEKGSEHLLSAKKISDLSYNLLGTFDFHQIGFVFADDSESEPLSNVIQIRWEVVEGHVKSEIVRKPTPKDLQTKKEHLELIIISPSKQKLKEYIEHVCASLKGGEKLCNMQKKLPKVNEWDHSIQYWVDHPMVLGGDNRIENNASIAFLLNYKGKYALFCGDASPDDMVKAGKRYLDQMSLPCEHIDLILMKMPHHGSSKNVTEEFLSLYKTRNYLISTNGSKKNQHPGKAMLAAVASALSRGEKAHFYANYSWWSKGGHFSKAEENWNEQRSACILKKRDGEECTLYFDLLTEKCVELCEDYYVRI